MAAPLQMEADMAPRKFKPTYPQLALFDWLMERDRRRFFSHHSGIAATHEVWLYETDGVDENGKKKLVRLLPNSEGMEGRAKAAALIERLGGRATIQTWQLLQQGHIAGLSMNSNSEAFEAFSSQFNKAMWHWSEHLYVVTDKGRAWWKETGRELFEAEKSKRDKERAAVERVVLLGRVERVRPEVPREIATRVPEGMSLPLPSRSVLRPQATAVVVKETTTRLYLRDVSWLRPVDYSSRVVEGREPSEYVAREHVILDGAEPETVERLMKIDAEYVEDVNRIAEQAVNSILPALLSLDSRLKQKDAEREDMMKEAIEAANSAKEDIGGPKP